jgi:hypothetical protein
MYSAMRTTGRNFQLIILITALVFIIPAHLLFGQEDSRIRVETKPAVYLGLGLSVNDYGLGAGLEIPLTDNISINGNAGVGGWGLKAGCSLNFYTGQISDKSEFSFGFSHASGLKNFSNQLWVEPNETEQIVNLDLNPAGT